MKTLLGVGAVQATCSSVTVFLLNSEPSFEPSFEPFDVSPKSSSPTIKSTPNNSKHPFPVGGFILGCAFLSISVIISRITGSYNSKSSQSLNVITRSLVQCPSGSNTCRSNSPSAATKYPPRNMNQFSFFEFGGDTQAMYRRQPSLWPRWSVREFATEGCTTYVLFSVPLLLFTNCKQASGD